MTPNLEMKTINCTPEEIETVRQRFRESVKESPDAYDPKDVEKVQSDDWTVKRFIGFRKNNLDEATAALIKAMKWRKEMDVSSIKFTDFPSEFWWTGEIHDYVRDKNNCATVYCRAKFHKPLSEVLPLEKRFLIYYMEKMEEEVRNGSNGWALIYDLSGATIFNNNMDLLLFMIQVIFEYYPMTLSYIAVYELPWVLRAIYYICQGLIPEHYRNLLHFVNKDNIFDYAGQENMPDYLGGTCERRDRIRVPGTLSLRDFIDKGIKESAINKFFSHYQKYLDIGDEEEKLKDKNNDNSEGQIVSNNNKVPIETYG